MKTFEKLFGINENSVKDTCILMPIAQKTTLKYLGIKELHNGILYGSANSEYFTVIHTRIGAAFTGDAVLYLDQTACKNIILFGSCGSTVQEEKLEIGGLVSPFTCYALESFSDMLSEKTETWQEYRPNKDYFEDLISIPGKTNITKVKCATLGSLQLERYYLNKLKERDIGIVDMECSAFFSAANYICRKAIALFYVTDIINKKPFYGTLDYRDKQKLACSIKSAANILCNLIQKKSSC